VRTTIPTTRKENKLTLPCTIRPPHEARTEAVRPICLIATGAVDRIGSPTQARQLPAFDPVEFRIKRDLVRDQHALESTPARVPHGIKLRPAVVGVLIAAGRILYLQYGAGRTTRAAGGSARGRRIWERIVDEDEIGSAALDATLRKAPVGFNERLCIGIVEGRLGEWDAGASRQRVLGRHGRRGNGTLREYSHGEEHR
jgi:hypothetical protein